MKINEVTFGMTPQDKEIYFKHMEKRHREEAEKVNDERFRLQEYKKSLIEDIIRMNPKHSRDELMKKTTRTIERILY